MMNLAAGVLVGAGALRVVDGQRLPIPNASANSCRARPVTCGKLECYRSELRACRDCKALRRALAPLSAVLDSAVLGRRRLPRFGRADRAAQLAPNLLGDEIGILAVPDDLGPDENDQLGTLDRFVCLREELAQHGNLVENRNTITTAVLGAADEAGEEHGLATRDSDRALHLACRHCRRQRVR